LTKKKKEKKQQKKGKCAKNSVGKIRNREGAGEKSPKGSFPVEGSSLLRRKGKMGKK